MALDSTSSELSAEETQHMLASLDQRVGLLEKSLAALEEKQGKKIDPEEGNHPAPQRDEHNPPPGEDHVGTSRRPWLLTDLLVDFSTIFRMFFDIHYRMAWSTRLTVLIFLPLFLTSHWWFLPAQIWAIGGFLDKVLDLFLIFFVFKALSREARRYRERER